MIRTDVCTTDFGFQPQPTPVLARTGGGSSLVELKLASAMPASNAAMTPVAHGAALRAFDALKNVAERVGDAPAAVSNSLRAAYNRDFQESAKAGVAAAIADPKTSSIARDVLRSFMSGDGPRQFYFGPNSAIMSLTSQKLPLEGPIQGGARIKVTSEMKAAGVWAFGAYADELVAGVSEHSLAVLATEVYKAMTLNSPDRISPPISNPRNS